MTMGWLRGPTCLLLMAAILPALGQTQFKWSPSEMAKQFGHYPYIMCSLTNVVLNASDGVFYYASKESLLSDCGDVGTIWPLQNRPQQSQTEIQCDEEYDIGHIFLFFYFGGGSNYYHLHYDTMLPLYKDLVVAQNDSQGPSRVLMPSVERSRLQKIDWKTPAFEREEDYWVQTVKFIAGKYPFRPLDDRLRKKGHNICLKEARFGTPQVTFSDKTFMRSFVKYVKGNLQIVEPDVVPPRVGVIHRSGRRQILNDQELVDMLIKDIPVDAELIDFSGMSFKEQVQAMQRFTVLAGINGAGLMNCLYLPANAVCIQMGPYKSDMNYGQFGEVLKSRGPYREWHNTHEDLHRPVPGDKHNTRPDTIVHLDEFRTLIQEALRVASGLDKDEL